MTKNEANRLARKLFREGKVVMMYRERSVTRLSGFIYHVVVVVS